MGRAGGEGEAGVEKDTERGIKEERRERERERDRDRERENGG